MSISVTLGGAQSDVSLESSGDWSLGPSSGMSLVPSRDVGLETGAFGNMVALVVGRFITISSNVTITMSVCIVECNKGVWSGWWVSRLIGTSDKLACVSVSLVTGGRLVAGRLFPCGLARLE